MPAGAAIKADAYGLGARPVFDRLVAEGARDFFVACWREAAELGPIPEGVRLHVLHGVTAEEGAFAAGHPATPMLNSPEQCALWRSIAPGRPASLMVDTGINRLGLSPADLPQAAAGLSVDILASHFACADEPGHPTTVAQAARFAAITFPSGRRSLANSAALFENSAFALDVARPGLALYGGEPHPAAAGSVAQVARIEAQILQLRSILPGESVGYGQTFTAAQPMRIAILGLGYADGYRRAFGNAGHAKVDGVLLPVIGRVSMDLTAIDVTAAPGLAVGDWIELDFDLPQAARVAGVAQYELLTGLGLRLSRRYIGSRA